MAMPACLPAHRLLQVKSRTKGYASMSFTEIGFREDNLVRLDIRINGEDAPPLATVSRLASELADM